MKVILIAWPGEGEYDFFLSCQQFGIDVELFFVDMGNIKGYLAFSKKSPPYSNSIPAIDPPGIKYTLINTNDIGRIINETQADLYILKYPQSSWSLPDNQQNVVSWQSEQGITLEYAIGSAIQYQNIGVNNTLEITRYKETYNNKHILYMPFGCYNPEISQESKIYDLIVDGRYGRDGGIDFQQRLASVDTMVMPVLDYNIALYGVGWELLQTNKHKGLFYHWEYPSIYALGKIYLGITWNAPNGGYGIKLARALSTGIPVIWHRTVGMELDGFERGNQLDWSSSPEETRSLVDYYLSHDSERIEMGKRGKEWALNNWQWGSILKRIKLELT